MRAGPRPRSTVRPRALARTRKTSSSMRITTGRPVSRRATSRYAASASRASSAFALRSWSNRLGLGTQELENGGTLEIDRGARDRALNPNAPRHLVNRGQARAALVRDEELRERPRLEREVHVVGASASAHDESSRDVG